MATQLPDWLQKCVDSAIKDSDWPNGEYPHVAFETIAKVANVVEGSDAHACLLQLVIDETQRLRAQRDRAWRTLGQVDDALGTASIHGLAFILTDSHGPDDAEEWNAVLAAEGRDKS